VEQIVDSSPPGAQSLADRFVPHVDAAVRASLPAGDVLGRALAALLQSARAAWPSVTLDEDRFLVHVASRLSDDQAAALEHLLAADLYVACACAAGDERAIAALEARYFPDLRAALGHGGADAATIDEALQLLRHELFVGPRSPLARYTGAGSLRSFLRAIAVRCSVRARKHEHREIGDDEFFLQLSGGDDPELRYHKTLYRDRFKAAFAEALSALEVRQRNLLRQHFLDGLTVDDLGRLYRVHRATAARWVSDARTALLDATRSRLRAQLGVESGELDSIVRLVLSQLDVSLTSLSGI
jgi:RNA polymerase sigma-70 factor (ECF subfamily)